MGYQVQITRRSLLTALSLFPASWRLRGQDQDQPPVPKDDTAKFSTGVKVVNLFATVRTKKGEIVRDLTKDDFLLDEDGRPQEIRYFATESNLPLTLGLLVDTSGSQRRVLYDERNASNRFLEQVLREDKDLAFVIHFDFEVELLQDLTSSRAKLEKALDDLQVATGNQQQSGQQGGQQGGQYPNGGGYPGGGYPGGGMGYPGGMGRRRGGMGYPGGGQPYPTGQQRRRGGGTCLYDAIVLASDELMRKQQGRKALILLTDGVDTGSKLTLSEAVAASQRADTFVYSILFSDPQAYGNTGGFGGVGRRPGMGGGGMNMPDGKKVLEQISRETGGRFFEVSKKLPIDKVYAAIEEDLRNQYSLGYSPNRTDEDRSYHRIHLETKRKELVVQAREGYYPT